MILPNVQTAVLGGMFLTIAMVLGEVVIANQLALQHAASRGDDPVRRAQDNTPGSRWR